jgi:hypothetical protein
MKISHSTKARAQLLVADYESHKLFSYNTWKYRVHKYGNIGKVSQFLLKNLNCLNRRQSISLEDTT